MGLFSRRKEDELTHRYPKDSYGYLSQKQDKDVMTDKLFDILLNVDIKLGSILSLFGIDDIDSLYDKVSDIDIDIKDRTRQLSVDSMDDEILGIFKVFGYLPVINNGDVSFEALTIEQRTSELVDWSECDLMAAIKVAAYIEGNMEIFKEIDYDASEEDYTLKEIKDMCDRLSTITFNEFLLKER